jgi:FkbM family methyltransferase
MRLFKMRAFKKGHIASGPAAGMMLVARNAHPSFLNGTYEQPMQNAVAAHLSEGDVFYDVGANIGFFSLIAARRVGAAGAVYAFEPVPENAKAIAESVKLNNLAQVLVYPNAVGAFTGQSDLLLADHIGGAALASVAPPPDLRGRIKVDVVTIDELVARRGLRPPALMKIDVEGAELDVLRGMAETLKAYHPNILYEIDDPTPQGAERKSQQIVEFLAGAGFDIVELPRWYDCSDWQVNHFLAIHRPEAD